MPLSTTNTIFALATPQARSGVAIIRISGHDARQALALITRRTEWTHAALTRADFYSSDGVLTDQGMAVFFAAPRSFTGEDIAELHCHGSLAVIRELLAGLGQISGLRHAEPGEFSRRAFLNGKMDLLEAEGLADLIEAETPAQKAQALKQMGGGISRHYEILRTQILQALAHLEAYIDFPEEEIPEAVLSGLSAQVMQIKGTIAAALDDHGRGERLREGVRVVILGAPNAGKSSLLNALARRDAAIVSQQAGTTRDVIEVHMNLAGFPVILTDTAGLRESSDEIEGEGIRRAMARAGEADITLLLFDGSRLPVLDQPTLELMDKRSILIISKSDIMNNGLNTSNTININPIYISTIKQDGLNILMEELQKRIEQQFSAMHSPIITRARHRALLYEALRALERFSPGQPLEMACEELRLAAGQVGKITGKIAVDDVLDVVFKQFCIGK